MESLTQFESRKQDHVRLALDPQVQTKAHGLERIELIHEALPEINFSEIDVSTQFLGLKLSSPLFISSMTAGHHDGQSINLSLARLSSDRQILMGVGSQRRELQDPSARDEWKALRREAPGAILFGNLGLAQLIQTPLSVVQSLVDSLEAKALFVHLNPLQEVLQPEGTPQFKGGLKKIEEVARGLSVPVVIKEVGCGFSISTLEKLKNCGIFAVDVSGYGGTHWGRIEGQRATPGSLQSSTADAFANWGISTLDSMLNAAEAHVNYQIWASGGVRTGLDAAKLFALGAKMVGLAHPWLVALKSSETQAMMALHLLADRLEHELKTSMFCTGCRTLADFGGKKVWGWQRK